MFFPLMTAPVDLSMQFILTGNIIHFGAEVLTMEKIMAFAGNNVNEKSVMALEITTAYYGNVYPLWPLVVAS